MASTITAATMTVTITESVSLGGEHQGATNSFTVSSINEIHTLKVMDGTKKAINEGSVNLEGWIFEAGVDLMGSDVGYGIGDVNGDGTVNVGDIVSLVNHILEDGDLDSLGQMSADVNQDGAINVLDVVEMAWLILGGD